MAELGEGLEDQDDSSYFAVLPAPPGLLGGLALLTEAAALARIVPGIGSAERAAIQKVIAQTEQEVTRATALTASFSERAIRDRIDITRVRPEISSFGFMVPKKKLADGVQSAVLGLGMVGIGDISEMDSVVGTDGRAFWRTQEYGSDHNVGRVIYGLFQPGGSPARGDLFRKHPVFVTGERESRPMVIRRPIGARHFMRDGTGEATTFREREFRAVEQTSIAQIRAIKSGIVSAGRLLGRR